MKVLSKTDQREHLTELTNEVRVANQDIGFVNPSHIASVKLETFPYTKYGTVDAQVKLVTTDAVTDEKTGQSHYPTLLTLSRKTMDVDGKTVPISPAMNIAAVSFLKSRYATNSFN